MSAPGDPPLTQPSSPFRHLGALAPALAGAALGLITGALREGSVPTGLLLYTEPLPAVVGVCIVHLCFVTSRWTAGLSAAIGLSSFLFLSRVVAPVAMDVPAGTTPADVRGLAECSAHAVLPGSWILAVWTGADSAATVSALTDTADVVVLLHPHVAIPTAEADHPGEFMSVPGGNVVWSRGGFSACGDRDTWAVGRASALVFAAPAAEASVPLLVSDLPALGPELNREIADLTVIASSLTGPVIAAGASFPTSFRRTDQRLAEAGVTALRLPPNAPSALGGLSLLALRAVNRVWTSEAWSGRGEVLDTATAWAAPVVLRLDPTYQTP